MHPFKYLFDRLRSRGHRDHRHRDGHAHPSSHDRGHRGFESGHDHVGRSRARDDRPYEESSHDDEAVLQCVLDGENVHDGFLNAGHVQNQNQIARMLKVAYGPTGFQC